MPRVVDPGMDARIGEVARRQGGVVAHRQLRALGVSDSTIAWRTDRRRWVRLHRGVYSLGPGALTRIGQMHAARLAIGDDAVVGFHSAIELYRIVPDSRRPIDVVVQRKVRPHPGIRAHQSRCVPPSHVVVRRGLPTTILERALLDVSTRSNVTRVAHLMHEGAYRRCFRVARMRRVLDQLPTHPGHAIAGLALQMHVEGSAGTRSELERRFLALLARAGIEPPQVNRHHVVGAVSLELDAAWPDRRCCVEIDGPGHLRARTRRDDAARDALLRAAGFRVLRVSAVQIDHDAEGLTARVRSLVMERPADTSIGQQ